MRVAVRRLRVEDVDKLQALVVENFDAIEPGLTVLDSCLLLGHATIDVVGTDTTGVLVLGAVGFSANEEMLLKAVEAYSWCLEYPQSLQRLYPKCRVSEARPPRLLFVVERMPDAFHRKIKQLGFPEVDCVEVRHLEFDGTPAVYFESLLRLRRHIGAADAREIAPEPTVSAPSAETAFRGNEVRMPPQASPRTDGDRAGIVVAAPSETTAPRPAPRGGFGTPPTSAAATMAPTTAAPAAEAELPSTADAVVALELDPVVASLCEPVSESSSVAPAAITEPSVSTRERVSFKELATALLDATVGAQDTAAIRVNAPIVTAPSEPAAAPSEPAVVPLDPPAPQPRPSKSVGPSAAPAGSAPVPAGFEGFKFPNDAVLTRQWMEFLNQMSATK
jgi:hypothetical protein